MILLFYKLANANKIDVFFTPFSLTHFTKLFDAGVFQSFKKFYSKATDRNVIWDD